jgi:peptidylprolyl isomerase
MARAKQLNSADSQFFVTRGDATRLDRQYTGWGHVVGGIEVVYAMNTGTVGQNPLFRPDRLIRAVMASQLPENERPRVFVAREGGAAFNEYIDANRNAFEVVAPVCELSVPRIIVEPDGRRVMARSAP